MKRYDLSVSRGMIEQDEDEYGDWVRYDDHKDREQMLQTNYDNLNVHYHAAARMHAENVQKLQSQLEAMTKERDHYKRLVELSDALRNAERGYGINPLFNANQRK